ncbi:MAG: glycoside hydrolase family 13 protein [Christensenellales bacterium]|jgi:glycosidase
MAFYHDSRDIRCRNPFGAVRQGTTITISARCDSAVTLRLWQDGSERLIPMTLRKSSDLWQASFSAGKVGIIWYYFIVGKDIYCAPADLLGGQSCLHKRGERLDSHQITVYDAGFSAPEWMRESVMYQIFPDRFFDGRNGELLKKRPEITIHTDKTEPPYVINDVGDSDPEHVRTDDFYGGNLPGIQQKLDYIKEMGFSAVYLNPIFQADSYHKYDTGDYENIDPTFGSNDDFVYLCESGRGLGIRFILDGVFSHTGSNSVYFNKNGKYPSLGAYQSKKSPYFSWYKFIKHPDEYDCWWDFITLPNVNEMDPGYIRFILTGENAVIKKWLRLGAAGWRLDVADELPDEFIATLRKSVKEADPHAAIIGEVWEDATNKVSYGHLRSYAHGAGLDSVMNYPLRDALIAFLLGEGNSFFLKRKLDSQAENYPKDMYYSLMNLIGSHDRSRIINILGECDDQRLTRQQQRDVTMSESQYDTGKKRLKLMARAIFALPGMPCVYYGDEAGLQGMRDPLCRAFFPWGLEDVELQSFFKGLIARRNERQVLKTGFVTVSAPHPDVIEIRRYYKGGKDAFGHSHGQDVFTVRIDRRL